MQSQFGKPSHRPPLACGQIAVDSGRGGGLGNLIGVDFRLRAFLRFFIGDGRQHRISAEYHFDVVMHANVERIADNRQSTVQTARHALPVVTAFMPIEPFNGLLKSTHPEPLVIVFRRRV